MEQGKPVVRKRDSFGKFYHHPGKKLILDESPYKIDYTREFYLFNIIPMGAVRMSNRDRIFTNPNHPDPAKRQREIVEKYFKYKNEVSKQAKEMGFQLGEFIEAVYLIPMPGSWSEKKKAKYNGTPCKVKPDTDNITKALKDIFKISDSDVWLDNCQKRWAYYGSIIIYK